MADIPAILSRLLREPVDPFAVRRPDKPGVPGKPEAPVPPQVPGAQFVKTGAPPAASLPGAGQLTRLGAFVTLEQAVRLPESTGGKAEFAAQHSAVVRIAEQLNPNLMTQLFPFFKSSLKADERERREGSDEEQPKFSSEAEEQALELLEMILDMAAQTDDMPAFLQWLDERLQVMEYELVKRTGSLPEKAERMFLILRQAAEALAHGVPAERIRSTLKAEISRKQDLSS